MATKQATAIVNNNDDKIFKDAGFTRADAPVKRRLIMALDGLEKSGKTHFTMTAPEPIGVIDIDIGLDGVVQKFQNKKKIFTKVAGISLDELKQMPKEQAQREASKAYDDICKAYSAIMGKARSIIIDNATELWELVRLAHFGKLDHIKAHHYGPVNQEYRSFVRFAYDQDRTNLILLHKMKDEYVDDKRTGKKQRAGFSDTGFLCQVNAECWRDYSEQSVPDCFHMTVADCRQNAELAGVDFSGADLTFANLAMQVFPETQITDWE